LPELGSNTTQITDAEIEQAVSRYRAYSLDLNEPMPQYLIVPAGADNDMRNVGAIGEMKEIGEAEGFRVLRVSARK
jgi:hypothetical protein